MAGLDPAIHDGTVSKEDVDARIKVRHDDYGLSRLVQRAARFAKADLSTGMVGEFRNYKASSAATTRCMTAKTRAWLMPLPTTTSRSVRTTPVRPLRSA